MIDFTYLIYVSHISHMSQYFCMPTQSNTSRRCHNLIPLAHDKQRLVFYRWSVKTKIAEIEAQPMLRTEVIGWKFKSKFVCKRSKKKTTQIWGAFGSQQDLEIKTSYLDERERALNQAR